LELTKASNSASVGSWNQLQSREADLELACLALEGALGPSAGDH
jgi:hypothetical protein